MGKVNCLCGKWQISDVGSPSINNGHLITDNDLDMDDDIKLNSSQIMGISSYIWECCECGRIAFEQEGNDLLWYKPENGKFAGLMGGKVRNPKKELVSLENYNEHKMTHHFLESKFGAPDHVFNGIACPNCGDELYDSEPNATLMSDPPQKSVECLCNYKGLRYC